MEKIVECDNPECQERTRQWLEMLNEKLKPPPGVKKIWKVPFLNIVIQVVEKY